MRRFGLTRTFALVSLLSMVALGLGIRDFNCKRVYPGLAGDLERLLPGRPGRARGDQKSDEEKGIPLQGAHGFAFTRMPVGRQSENRATVLARRKRN